MNANNTPQRAQLGLMEEYYESDGSASQFGAYLGHRRVETSEQPLGAEKARTFELGSDLELQRSFSKRQTIKAGTLVRRVVWPLEGREI